MRILFLNPSGQMGGAERSLSDVLASLRQAEPGWHLELIAGSSGPFTVKVGEELGIPTQILGMPDELAQIGDAATGGPAGAQQSKARLLYQLAGSSVATAHYARRLRRFISRARPDVLHTNGFKMHLLGAWTAANTPLVWHLHDYVGLRPVMGKLLRMHVGRCATAIANSHSVAKDFQRVCGEKAPAHVVSNAVDLDQFSPIGDGMDLDAACGLPPAAVGTVRVGLVATLARWKGHETFLRAVAQLPVELAVRAYVVGGSIYETAGSQWRVDELKKMASDLELTGRVGFTGFLPRPAEAMRALDIVVHASTQPEPFGLVIAEAMACARAVVVSRWGGPEEFTEDGVDAMQHRPGDSAGLGKILAVLAGDRNLRQQLGCKARQTAERHFDRKRLAKQLIPIYNRVIERTAKAA